MKELIDKAALVAEIKRRRDESWLGEYTKEKGIIFDITDDILSFLDTLEVKEV
jgi:geranylgeranyl pyrophosphate synthase